MKNLSKQQSIQLDNLNFKWNDESRCHEAPAGFIHFFTFGTEIAYISRDDIKKVFTVAELIGNKNLFYVANEVAAGEDLDEVDKNFAIDEADQLIDYHFQKRKGSEFYLIGEDFNWMVWAFHEPCAHVASKNNFSGLFKDNYPDLPTCDPLLDSCLIKWEGQRQKK